jgi:hypothetical protein
MNKDADFGKISLPCVVVSPVPVVVIAETTGEFLQSVQNQLRTSMLPFVYVQKAVSSRNLQTNIRPIKVTQDLANSV